MGGGDPAEARRGAEELVALPADVIMVTGQLGLEVLLQAHSVPIVFNSVLPTVVLCDLERKRTSSTSSAGLPKRRAADTYPCDASWPGPSWQCMSLDRYTQSTLNVARNAKKSEVEGKSETQIEYQEVQEG